MNRFQSLQGFVHPRLCVSQQFLVSWMWLNWLPDVRTKWTCFSFICREHGLVQLHCWSVLIGNPIDWLFFKIFFNQGFYFTISENFVWNVLGIQWECIFPIHSEVQKPAWHCLCSKLYFPWILCITGWGVRSKPGAHSSSACMIHCHLLIIFFSMAPKQGQHLTEGCKIKKKGVLVWLN